MSSPERPRRYDRAILITNQAETHSHTCLLAGLHQGLIELGWDSRLFLVAQDGSDLGPFVAAVEDARRHAAESTALIDLNGKMRFELSKRLKKFSMLIDHPFAHFEPLLDAPADAVIGYLDRSHRDVLEAVGLHQDKVFLPHGGPPPDSDPKPIAERTVPALFCGRLETSPRITDLRDGLAGNPEIVRDIVLDTAEQAAERVPLFSAFGAACRARGLDFDAFDLDGLATALQRASDWAEAHHRHKHPSALSGVDVHLVGSVMDGFFETGPDHITFLGPRPFVTCIEMMREARVLLNSVTVFPTGSHERDWYAMAAGAALLTDRSAFVEETFTAGENILFWPEDPAAITDLSRTVLRDAEHLQNLADAATPIYAAHHTWRQRAEIVDGALNSI